MYIIYTKMVKRCTGRKQKSRHLLPLEKRTFQQGMIPVGCTDGTARNGTVSRSTDGKHYSDLYVRALYMVRWLSLMQVSII